MSLGEGRGGTQSTHGWGSHPFSRVPYWARLRFIDVRAEEPLNKHTPASSCSYWFPTNQLVLLSEADGDREERRKSGLRETGSPLDAWTSLWKQL